MNVRISHTGPSLHQLVSDFEGLMVQRVIHGASTPVRGVGARKVKRREYVETDGPK